MDTSDERKYMTDRERLEKNIYHGMYLGIPFLPPRKNGLECPLQHLSSEQLLPLSWPGACADIPTKTDHDVIRVSYGDVPMM